VEALSHDVDGRRGIINAHMVDENRWMQSIESKIGQLKQDISVKASLAEVKIGLESTRCGCTMSIDAAVSPLQAQMKIECSSVMNEVNALRVTMQNQLSEVSTSTQAFQRNLIEAVEENSKHGKKEYVNIISQIVATVSRPSIPSHRSAQSILSCFAS
jgi:hypothetical protein